MLNLQLLAAFFARIGIPEAIARSTRLQQRGVPGAERVVVRLALPSGRELIVKARNDRACRETPFYRTAFRDVRDLTPEFLGAASIDGVSLLALEYVEGRHPHPHDAAERARAAAALARFHQRFTGATPADVLGIHTADPKLRREATTEPTGPASAGENDPLVLDPGDFRPENVLVSGERAILIDFENAAIRRRRRAVALAAALWPEPERFIVDYFASLTALDPFAALGHHA